MPTSSGVSITPGITQFTRTPFCATSLAAVRVRPDRAVLGGVVGAGAREPALGADRGGVDHRALACGNHVREHEAQAEEHAAQVHAQHLVEHRDIVFVRRREVTFDPGVVEEPVDPAPGVHRGAGVAFDRRVVGAVGEMADDVVTARLQPCSAVREPVAGDVDQHHFRPFTGEYFRGGEADRPSGARHHHRLAFVAHHLAPLRKGRVSRNRISLGVSSLNAARACSASAWRSSAWSRTPCP
jgi:hypothetical protein